MSTAELAVFSSPEPDKHGVEIVRALSEAEYEEYVKARRLVSGFVSDYQQFTMVRNSYGEYDNS